MIRRQLCALLLLSWLGGCGQPPESVPPVAATGSEPAAAGEEVAVAPFAGLGMGLAYSGFRAGQHPDRGAGASNPSAAEIVEDLDILVRHGFRLIRLYDAGENSAQTLSLIRERGLPIKVLLGAWLRAELSNHEGCPWLDAPIPETELAANRRWNGAEIGRVIELANDYPDIVVAVNVGNEALVEWTDHLVPVDRVISLVRAVRDAVSQPVGVAENYAWWPLHGAALARELDFLGVHSYPQWEGQSVQQALSYTIENVNRVRRALPGAALAVLEAGWATEAVEFEGRASERDQARYFAELHRWSERSATPVFFFEAFDEPWKGNPEEPAGAEKHWGVFKADRSPKAVMEAQPINLYDPAAVAWAVNFGGDDYRGADGTVYEADKLEMTAARGNMGDVLGSQDPELYSSYRKGPMTLLKSLPNGIYDITFHFAEPGSESGERIFNVLVQGREAIQGLDVRRQRDGMARSALARTVTGVEITDGRLQLELLPLQGEPVLSALVVRTREADSRAWELVWADEFDYEGVPDPAKWSIEEWAARRVNNEDQAYTAREKNVRVAGGRLVLEAHREEFDGAKYTSGRIHSRGKGDWLYGRVDIRARLPGGQGSWPALWMLPSDAFRYATNCDADPDDWQGDKECDAWPNSGEIDIMEHVGYDMHRLHGTVHNKAYYWKNWQQRKGSVEVRDLHQVFHVYSLVWTPDILYIYLDGTPYFSYWNDGTGWKSWPYDHPYHLILNLAIGGSWGSAGGPIDDSIFPARLEVDYVRVFRPVE